MREPRHSSQSRATSPRRSTSRAKRSGRIPTDGKAAAPSIGCPRACSRSESRRSGPASARTAPATCTAPRGGASCPRTRFVSIALQAALAAQRVLPERADIAALVDEVREELTSEDHDIFELAAPMVTPAPGEVTSSPAVVDSGVLNWAEKLRASLRRGKA